VRSMKPPEERRRSGSGRAATPEAEAARRAKISRAVRERNKRVRVLIQSDYRLPSREHDKEGRVRPHLKNWDYRGGRVYSTYVPAKAVTDRDALQKHLNRLHPNRAHFRTEIVEFL